ncbi:MAG: hypothetical protein CMJ19_04100 [Phycisphaeraceae bacterium]|nr:hypothetical protein [Phycisphaeraceae bacterium]
MLHQRNIFFVAMSLGVIMVMVGLTLPLKAQTQAAEPASVTQTPTEPAEPAVASVDWDDAQQLHKQITQWIANGKVDEVDPLQSPPTHLVSNLGGVCVTLRWMGKAFGMGESHVPLNKHNMEARSDLLHHARVATSEALQSLKVRLPQWGRLPLEERPKLLVDLQVAKAGEPIPPLAAKRKINVLSLASPDAQGLIIENTDRKTAWCWPATNLALNLSPTGVVKGMLLELGRKPSLEISLLDEVNPMHVYRFDVIHIVQPNSDTEPVHLKRGMTVLDPILEHKQIMDAAWKQATYLAHRFREDGRIAATYEPTSSRYSLQDAPLDEQAMTGYALSNQLLLALDTQPDWEGYGPCSKALRSSVTYLLSIINDHVAARDPDAVAWLLMTLIQEPSLADLKSRRDELAKMLMTVQQTDGQFTQKRADANGMFVTQPVNRFNQALIHLALLKQYDQTRDKTLFEILSRSADILTNQASKQTLMAIPTLYAIRDLQDKLETGLPIPVDTVMVIKQTRALLLNHQITQNPSMGPADVIGGFDLARQSPNVAPSPDWRSSYGVSLLATILKDEALRPRLAESVGLSQTELLLRSALAARFIVQLTYRPEEVFYGDSAVDCVGGVRQSPWDNTLSLKATAVSLLSLQQFNEAVTQSLKQTATP